MAPPPGIAWSYVQVGDLLDRVREPLDRAVAALGVDLVDVIESGDEVSLDAERVARLKEAVADLVDVVDQLGLLVESLPVTAVDVDRQGVRRGAVDDLVEGILDPRRVLLAAETLDARDGYGALARALRESGARVAWGETSLDEVLTRFRDADRSLAVEIAGQAGVPAGLVLAQAGEDEIELIAVALERFAGG